MRRLSKTPMMNIGYDMDAIGTFVLEVLNVDATNSWHLSNKLLYDAYIKWFQRNNERQMSQKGLSIRLQEKGFKRGVTSGTRFWYGLAVKPEWLVLINN